jgi:ribosomal protein S18 acetylase RimI-like enzyme
LRPATAADEPFLYEVYASTREAELAPLAWDDATKEAFLRSQFTAQDYSYRRGHPNASFDVVTIDGRPAGRLYVDRGADAIHVIEIALLPEHRGRGVGSELLRALLEEGLSTATPVTLNALRSSAALSLYRRLGFEIVQEDDVYLKLECSPVR